MGKSKRSKDDDYTTIEPLNYLLRSRSVRTLVFWSIMTAASFAAVIGTCTALVMKYQRQDTNVLTRLTDGRYSSFPAVTICNLNPYKKSVLSTIPPAAHIMKMYEINLNSIKSASNETSQNQQLNSDETSKNVATKSIADDDKESNGVKRVKRSDREADSCTCDYTNAITTTNSSASSSIYVLYPNIRTTWECIFKCCANSTVGTNGRPANLENKNTINFLARNGLLAGEIWVPMRCLNQTCNWYTSPSSPSGRSQMLDSCTQHDVDKSSEYSSGVGISFDPAENKVMVFQDRPDIGYKCLCEDMFNFASATPVLDFTYSTEGGPTVSASAATEKLVSLEIRTEPFSVLSSTPLFAIPSDTTASVSTEISPSSSKSGPSPTEISASSKKSSPMGAVTVPVSIETSPNQSPVPLSTKQTWSPTDNVDSMAVVSRISTETFQKTSITSTDSVSTVASFFPQEPENTWESIINQTIEQILGDSMVKWDQNVLSVTAVDLLGYVMGQLPKEQVIKAGYNRPETIMHSFYKKGRLAPKKLTLHTDPNYGNCYTFNLFGSDTVSIQLGSEKGFSVAYLIGEEEYPSFVQSSGVRVIIHEQGDPIFPDINGYSVASRTRSSISLKKNKIETITTRKKKCAATASDPNAYVFKDSRYTVEACLKSCYQTGVIEHCKCGDPRIPLPMNSSVRFCDVTKRSCVDAYYNSTREPECQCPHECELEFYDASLSTTVWSSGYDTTGIFASSEYGKNFTLKQNMAMAMIDVYLDSLTTVGYVEVIGYTISDLLWDMSSAIGLFTGMSVISIFESINCVQFLLEKYRKQ